MRRRSTDIFLILLAVAASPGRSAELPSISPEIGAKRELTEEGKKAFDEKYGDSDEGDYFTILGPDCSWYCGGKVSVQGASSFLAPQKGFTYGPKNAHDDSLATAWVEGVPGNGAGEWISYEFPPQNPRITSVLIYNGLVKSDRAWKANARVKKLLLSIDEKPYAVLDLADTPALQTFDLGGPIQPLDPKKAMLLRFTIQEVYPGDKYQDTALTEIYFNGIGVH